jgi:hypothetical protein
MRHNTGMPRHWLAQGLICLLGLLALGPVAAETRSVVAEGANQACFLRDVAVDLAFTATRNDANAECRSLGPGWRYGSETFNGYLQCNRCGKSEEFRCTVKQAVHVCVNMEKEQAEAAEKRRAEREAKRQAEQAEAARQKALMEMRRQEQKAKADRDRAERERLAKEQAARDKVAREEARQSSDSGNPLDDAFERRQGKSTSNKPSNTGSGALDDAFARRQGLGAASGSGNVLDDSLQQRADRMAERERQVVLKARTDEATAICQAAAKGVEACLSSSCGREPGKFSCTDGYMDSGSCNPKPGSACITIPRYICRAEGPNPDHAKWQACTRDRRAQCEPVGSVDDCVRQRLSAAK